MSGRRFLNKIPVGGDWTKKVEDHWDKQLRNVIISALNATESGVFSKSGLFQILYIYFLVSVFSEDDVTEKT